MLEALIAGERDPHLLAELARGRMRVKRAALLEALTGRFDAHHAELARLLLEQIDALSAKIEALSLRIDELIAQIPAAQAAAVDQPLVAGQAGKLRRRSRPSPASTRSPASAPTPPS